MARRREAILLAVGAGVFVLFCWQFSLVGFVDALRNVQPIPLALYAVCALVVLAGYTFRWYVVARSIGPSVGFGTMFSARVAGEAVGLLVPATKIAGDPVRVIALSARGVDTGAASAGVAFDRVLELMGNMVCTICYLGIFSITRYGGITSDAGTLLMSVLVALLVALSVPVLLWRRGRRPFSILYRGFKTGNPSPRRWTVLVAEVEDHLSQLLQSYPLVFFFGLALSVLIELLIVLEYRLLLASFSIDVNLGTLLLTTVATGVSRGAPTPAGLGALEGAQVALFAYAEQEAALGFVVAMVLRLHETFWIGVGMLVLLAQGFSLRHLLRDGKPAPP